MNLKQCQNSKNNELNKIMDQYEMNKFVSDSKTGKVIKYKLM